MKSLCIAGLFVCIGLVALSSFAVQQHPFLITTTNMFPELQAKAAGSPWSEIKASAQVDATNRIYTAGGSWVDFQEIMNDCALTYVLTPSLRAACRGKILGAIAQWTNDITRLGVDGWANTVPPGGTFFMSVIALDIIHPDCTPTETAAAEDALEPVYDWFNTNDTSWQLNLYGARMIWARYKGLPSASTHADGYYDTVMSHIEPDGFWTDSPGYAYNRLGGTASRTAKTYAADVMEFTGLDTRYYSSSRVKEFFRWVHTLGQNPARVYTLFGDTGSLYGGAEARYTRHFSVDRFAPEYRKYASWCVGDDIPSHAENSLFPYILMTNSMPVAETPVSRLYTSGAAFWERSSSVEALMCVLYNQHTSGHSHDDVNSFYVFGYGEHLVMNSGVHYNPSYPGTTPDGDEWRAAFLQNSVTIDHARTHAARTGNGITEGFTGGRVEYASADSGVALGNGRHLRSLVLVHPQPGKANGYFVLFDEVAADNPEHGFQVNIHPNSTNDPAVVSGNTEFTATANMRVNDPGGGEKITVFMATEPAAVVMTNAWFGTWSGPAVAGRYIESTYVTDANGTGRAVTVLFPHDDTHVKAAMTRVTQPGCTGAAIDHGGGTVDTVLESDGNAVHAYGEISFQARACLSRTETTNILYFARKGRFFDDGAAGRRGFQCASNVTVFMEDKTGHIVSPGAEVTFFYPGIEDVWLDGAPSTVTAAPGSATVDVPAGTFAVELLVSSAVDTSPPSVPTDLSAEPASPVRVDLSWTAASDSESGIGRYMVYRDGVRVGQPVSTNFSDMGLTDTTQYEYYVVAVNGFGLTATSATVQVTTPTDTIPPEISSAAAVSTNSIFVVFSEPVGQASAETTAHYSVDPDLAIGAATLAGDFQTVVLSVSPLTLDLEYMVTVTGVYDRALSPNLITTNNQATFTLKSIKEILYVSRSSAEDLQHNPVVDRLVASGHHVTAINASAAQASDADGKELVVINSLVFSVDVGNKFSAVAIPVILWEAALCDEFKISGSGEVSVTGTSIDVVNTNHALAESAGLTNLGVVVTRSGGTALQFADMDSLAAGATVIAEKVGTNSPAVVVIERGESASDGSGAPGMRIFLFYGDEGLGNATQAGLDIFDAAVGYALGGGAPIATSRGTPHGWLDRYELVNGEGDYQSADTNDTDVDRMVNWKEYRCGTVPTNAASVLKLPAAPRQLGETESEIRWQAVTSRTYTVLVCTNPAYGGWITNATGIVGNEPECVHTASSAGTTVLFMIQLE
ncbi:MAG: hypothetical protein HQ559_17395 [Lentisphaerae bacterium]|nr:hypothetical protein [Lentisphaerota bacterium]